MMMRKKFRYTALFVLMMVLTGCASSTRNEPNMSSKSGVGISNSGDGTEMYGSIQVGASGRL